jgi:hypothetical protein
VRDVIDPERPLGHSDRKVDWFFAEVYLAGLMFWIRASSFSSMRRAPV